MERQERVISERWRPYCFVKATKKVPLLYVVDSMLKTEPDIFFLSFKFA